MQYYVHDSTVYTNPTNLHLRFKISFFLLFLRHAILTYVYDARYVNPAHLPATNTSTVTGRTHEITSKFYSGCSIINKPNIAEQAAFSLLNSKLPGKTLFQARSFGQTAITLLQHNVPFQVQNCTIYESRTICLRNGFTSSFPKQNNSSEKWGMKNNRN